VRPWIHQRGSEFVNASGAVVQLRGANVTTAPATYEGAGSLGANFVRLPVYWADVEPAAPTDGIHAYDPAALGRIDAVVQWAESRGIDVLIDLHQWNWSPYFRAVPPGGGVGMPAWLYRGYPVTAEGRRRAIWSFYTDAATVDAYRAFLAMLVRRYRSYPNVFGFEVLNEPPRGQGPTGAVTSVPTILTWENRMAKVVWRLDPYRSAFFMYRDSGMFGFRRWGLRAFPARSRLALDVHDYFAGRVGLTATLTEPAYSGTLAGQLDFLATAMRSTRRWGIPLLVGEWGAYRTDPGLAAYQTQMLSLFRTCGLNASRWQLGSSRLGVQNADGSLAAPGLQIQAAFARPPRPGMRLGCLPA